MLINLFNFIIHNFMFFTGAYSNNAFPEPLSKEEEEEYINKMLHGDTNARSKLIEHNLRLVAHIVKKFESNTNDVDDLIGIGTVGLIKGIDSFSPDKNVRLTTYIAKCAENEILMYFRADKKNSMRLTEQLRHLDCRGQRRIFYQTDKAVRQRRQRHPRRLWQNRATHGLPRRHTNTGSGFPLTFINRRNGGAQRFGGIGGSVQRQTNHC